ncbi:MAG: histidine phosphatase family protein [Nocardiopsaceae bacterium]|nr:histidine phosphatase family protein [Nocardiopsaceae bacterium]
MTGDRAPRTPLRTLWLVRHGESTWNTLGLTQGHNDEAELTERGLRQAAEVAERFAGLNVRAIYASDLRRAQQTAAPLAAAVGIPVVLDARLRERNLGVLEGRHAAGNGPAVTGLDLKAGLLVDPDTRPEGGESVRDLYRRAAAFCDELASDAGAAPGADVVVVAHGGTLRVLRAYLSGVPVEQMDWAPLANATVLEFPGFDVTTREGER